MSEDKPKIYDVEVIFRHPDEEFSGGTSGHDLETLLVFTKTYVASTPIKNETPILVVNLTADEDAEEPDLVEHVLDRNDLEGSIRKTLSNYEWVQL